MKKDSLLQNDQFVISYELLHLLYWILKYEEGELSKLITKSFTKGLQDKYNNHDPLAELQQQEEMQNSIVDFFTFMEQEILDITDQKATQSIHKQIVKDLDHLDPQELHYGIIKEAVAEHAQKLKTKGFSTKKRDLFLKELLKNWKPNKEKNKKITLH